MFWCFVSDLTAINNPEENVFFGLYDAFMLYGKPKSITNEHFRLKIYNKWARYNICPDW